MFLFMDLIEGQKFARARLRIINQITKADNFIYRISNNPTLPIHFFP